METTRTDLIDIVREYLEVHERMSALFERFRSGDVEFAPVRDLCADDDRSPLFRLKERCHALFRRGGAQSEPMRRAALFDLAVGSLFHEAMKFRENVYQVVVYAPKVRALRDASDLDEADTYLFREFDKIQLAAEARMDEALQETESLLAHTGEQLFALVCDARDGLLTRYLIEQRERLGRLHEGGIEALLARIHGSAEAGYLAAGHSYLGSAHFGHALAVFDLASDDAEAARLRCYAEGMRAYLLGDYAASFDRLEDWLDAAPGGLEAPYLSLAHAAVSRFEPLVPDEVLVGRAGVLASRLEQLVPG